MPNPSFIDRILGHERQPEGLNIQLFRRKLDTGKGGGIYLVQGKDITGRHAWYYVSVEFANRSRFEKLAAVRRINLTDFGTILACAYGETPPPDVKKRMEEKYDLEESP